MNIENFEIISTDESYEPDKKRFCVPAIIKWECPYCGSQNKKDCMDDYFNYPEINKSFKEELNCKECDKYGFLKLKIKVILEHVK